MYNSEAGHNTNKGQQKAKPSRGKAKTGKAKNKRARVKWTISFFVFVFFAKLICLTNLPEREREGTMGSLLY